MQIVSVEQKFENSDFIYELLKESSKRTSSRRFYFDEKIFSYLLRNKNQTLLQLSISQVVNHNDHRMIVSKFLNVIQNYYY